MVQVPHRGHSRGACPNRGLDHRGGRAGEIKGMKALHDRTCSVEGCYDTVRCKKLCARHYQAHLQGRVQTSRRLIPRIGPCLVDGCDRPRRSRGLCAPHYDSGRRRTTCPACGGDMKATSGLCAPCHLKAVAAHVPTEKKCPRCARILPVSAYRLRKSGAGSVRWRSRCKECESLDSRAAGRIARRDRWDRSHENSGSPYVHLRGYAKRLGIPWAEVISRYPADNRCEVCRRTPQEANPSGRFVRLSLDHCHTTGALRGFLCGPCNAGIGALGDAPARLRLAIAYLAAAKRRSRPTVETDQIELELSA